MNVRHATTGEANQDAGRRRGCSALRWACAGLLFAGVAWAQAPAPGYLYPAGARRGETINAIIGGRGFRDGIEVWCGSPGVTVRVLDVERPLKPQERDKLREEADKLRKGDPAPNPARLAEIERQLNTLSTTVVPPALWETVRLEIAVAPDAPLGRRELRLRDRASLSIPLAFVVGELPETSFPAVSALQRRPSAGSARAVAESAAGALHVTLPAVVNGQVLAGEADRVRFTGKSGQGLVVSLQARALMPYLADAVPGWFQAVVTLLDPKGRELVVADDFRFQPDPVLAFRLPEDGEYTLVVRDALYRGREDFVYRMALGELPYVTGVFPLGARTGADVDFALTGWHLPATVRRARAPVERGLFTLPLGVCEEATGTVKVAADDLPEVLELEENSPAEKAMRLRAPVIVNGRIGRADDEDWFEFDARAGVPVVLDVVARKLRSPLDGVLQVVGPDGGVVATSDDVDDKGDGLTTHHADPRVIFTPKVDGRHRARLTDAQHQGGPDYAYRLRVSAPRPGFALRVAPSALALRPGAGGKATVFVLREDGFAGPVKLALEGVPDGWRVEPAEVAAGADKVEIVVTPPKSAEAGVRALSLEGTAEAGGVVLKSRAVAADDRMQAFFYRHLVPAEQWLACVAKSAPQAKQPAKEKATK